MAGTNSANKRDSAQDFPLLMIAGDCWLQKRSVEVPDTSGTTFGQATKAGNFDFLAGATNLELILYGTREHYRLFTPKSAQDAGLFDPMKAQILDAPYAIYGPCEYQLDGRNEESYWIGDLFANRGLPVERLTVTQAPFEAGQRAKKAWRVRSEQRIFFKKTFSTPKLKPPKYRKAPELLLLDIAGFGFGSVNSDFDTEDMCALLGIDVSTEKKLPVLIVNFRNRSGLFAQQFDPTTMSYSLVHSDPEHVKTVEQICTSINDLASKSTRRILILSIEDVRLHDETVSYQIGWERTVLSVKKAVENILRAQDWRNSQDPLFFAKNFNQIIVTLAPEAAVHFEIGSDGAIASTCLAYTGDEYEGDIRAKFPGWIKADDSIFAASVAHYEMMRIVAGPEREADQDYLLPSDLDAWTKSTLAKPDAKERRHSIKETYEWFSEWTRVYQDPTANLRQAIVLGLKALRVAHVYGYRALDRASDEETRTRRNLDLFVLAMVRRSYDVTGNDRYFADMSFSPDVLEKELTAEKILRLLAFPLPAEASKAFADHFVPAIKGGKTIQEASDETKAAFGDWPAELAERLILERYRRVLKVCPTMWMHGFYQFLKDTTGFEEPDANYESAGIDKEVRCVTLPVHLIASTIGTGNISPYRWYGGPATAKVQDQLRTDHAHDEDVWQKSGWIQLFDIDEKRWQSYSKAREERTGAVPEDSRLDFYGRKFFTFFELSMFNLATEMHNFLNENYKHTAYEILDLQDLAALFSAYHYLVFGEEAFLGKKRLNNRQSELKKVLLSASYPEDGSDGAPADGGSPPGVSALHTKLENESVDFFLNQWFKPFPCLKLGHQSFWDRLEIEMMREVYTLIASFLSKPSIKFLNLALLGPPGSGKSSGVKAIINSIPGGQRSFKFLEFNLSQFRGSGDLTTAFESITEAGISQIPVVTWDEYDSLAGRQPFGWVEQFLRAMQDGVYTTSSGDRQLPRAIFFFAGSRIRTAEELRWYSADHIGPADSLTELIRSEQVRPVGSVADPSGMSNHEDGSHHAKVTQIENWRNVKGRDFKSRLSYPLVTPSIRLEREEECVEKDIYSCLLRRAKAIRFNFQRFHEKFDHNSEIKIDFFVAIALLLVDYFDDLRSVENVLKLSSSEGRSTFDASCLPTKQALCLHCDWAQVEKLAFSYRTGPQAGKGEKWLDAVREIMSRRRPVRSESVGLEPTAGVHGSKVEARATPPA